VPGTIYLAPGGRHMTVVKRNNQPTISLNDGPLVNFCRPAVDPLFTSAAQTWGGANFGDDPHRHGLGRRARRGRYRRGRRKRHCAGRGEQASSGEWPGAAANAGVCSAVLPLDQIGPRSCGCSEGTSSDTARLRLSAASCSRTAPPRSLADKQYLVESRLTPLARKAGIATLTELVGKLKANNERLIVDVVEAMTTNESFFYRDKVPFAFISRRQSCLPLLAARAKERRLRIWCAAASTGQEPYSLAMCLKDMKDKIAGWRIEDYRHGLVDRSSGEGQSRGLQPVRSGSAACRSRCW